MIPFCKDQNIALTPYSPLASGRLAKKPSELSKRLQETESAVSSTLEPCSIRYCIALMKELKMELQKTAFAQISDCVPALSVPEIITQKNVRTAMEKAGFHVINGAIFDPHIHDAVHIEETDRVEEDRVVGEIQKGYFFGEKLYRPTKVIVSKNSCQK